MFSRLLFPALAILLFSTVATAQSGWLKEQGSGYSQLSLGFLTTNNYYNLSGQQVTTSDYQSYALNAYLEYGLSSRFNLLLNGPLLRRQSFSTTAATYGIGDVGIGVKYGLASGRWPLSLSVEVELPLSPNEQFAENNVQLIPGITDQINLPASDGELNARSTLALSHSFSDRSYLTVHTAFNLRSENLSHQIKTGLEAGYKFFDRFYLIGRFSAQQSLGAPKEGLSFVRGEGVEYTSVGLSAIYEISDKTGINLGLTTYNDLVFERRNIYSGPAINLGFSYQW